MVKIKFKTTAWTRNGLDAKAVNTVTYLRPWALGISLIALAIAGPSQAQDFDENGVPLFTPIGHHCEMKLPPPNPTGNPDLRLEGNGGYDPVRYDYDLNVLVDPVSGIPDTSQGEWGDMIDAETGAKFSMSTGLWLNPETLRPIQDKRLNDFPYYDVDTNEIIDPKTGERTAFEKALLTSGQSRMHQQNIAYACLGSDLTQRVDPKSGQYVASTRLFMPDDFDYSTIGIEFGAYSQPNGMNDVPSVNGFPRPWHFSADMGRNDDFINGMSRDEVVGKLYDRLAPETAEMGLYTLKERRVEDGIVTVITARELGDDAVHAEQYYLYFMTDMPAKDGTFPPRLMAMGYRHKCSRRDFSAAWTTQRCP